jgi:nucleoside-diphosphate-sugar epimerase
MPLLVTGATGFVGSRLAIEAAQRGLEVTGVGRSTQGSNIAALTSAGVRVVAGNILDPAFCAQATLGMTQICHLAAAWREASASAEHFLKINVEGTLNLARAAAANGVAKFVFCSTIGVHARISRDSVREDSAFDVTNPYENSKLQAERALQQFARETPMRIAILRPADGYGPGDLRLLKLFRMVKRGRFPLIGSGEGRRHMLYVDDLAAAFLAACEADYDSGEAFIIAGPETTTLLDLLKRLMVITGSSRFGIRIPSWLMRPVVGPVEDISRILGVPAPLHRRTLDFYSTDVVYDTAKAQQVLHWNASVGLDEGLRRTLEWYRAKGLMA